MAAKNESDQDRPAMRKTTILIPSGLLDAVKAWTEETKRSNGDAVLSAYLQHREAIDKKFATTDADARRAELGLPPLAVAAKSMLSDDAKVQMGLYVLASALDELSAAAKSLALSRSEYVAELLALEYDN